ncbi:peptidase family S58-domain-containing protein [Emericellopsis atlantica]|uniref:Peptidase family S58-domain-containing protein n=1 Tax=Emericellopsis atlantica TaxID=2614577 RepID=A0A9P7ZS31_9HYPO|nr:peptidase family S58-domain-containing protein [Emericellopsis atlantica]KAG9256822.1 peptidase family S58-domain-containing protein [Emericellopsis atlantica]
MPRIREVLPKWRLGRWPTGPHNSLTDVPGVLVHTQSLHSDEHSDTNTGVTTILPRKDWDKYSSFAGYFTFNGAGEMTSSHWVHETGILSSPIVLTTTSAIGDAYRGVLEYCYKHCRGEDGEMGLPILPCVAETFDGFLNDQSLFAVTPAHIMEGIACASSDPVPEGNTGGGTGMICHRFKGGTGSSSRTVKGFDLNGDEKAYTVGVLVQANYGSAETLHIGGVPVGQIIQDENKAKEDLARTPRKDGSIIVVIATDCPLLPIQLQRLAKRATVGLSKVGGYGNNTSGDIFLAFSTGNKIPHHEMSMGGGNMVNPYEPGPMQVSMSDNDTVNGLFEAVGDATEEAIYNVLCMAESMTGYKGRHVDALDLDKVKRIVEPRLG